MHWTRTLLRPVCALALSTLAPAQVVFTSDGIRVMGGLTAVPDLDGDGTGDWLAGDNTHDLGRGLVEARSGLDGSLLYSILGDPGSHFGVSMSVVGDLDADGVLDFAVGSPYDARVASYAGRVSLHSGRTGALLGEVGTPALEDFLGWAVASPGDVDGDGIPDIAASSLREDSPAESAGAVRVFSGATGVELWVAHGHAAYALFGTSLTTLADRTGDGVRELLVGEPGMSPEQVHVLSGADGSPVLVLSASDLTGDGRFGTAVAGVGDQDGDGIEDFVVGAPYEKTRSYREGLVRLIAGADGSTLAEWSGLSPGDRLGSFVGGVDDLDGDGRRELVMAAPEGFLGESLMGYVQVRSSSDGSVLRFWPGLAGETFGTAFAELGDRDGDGLSDTLVAAPGTTNGSVRLLSGGYATGDSYCFADTANPCPCGNQDPEGGCANATGAGARLFAFGNRSLAVDDMHFVATGLPQHTTAMLLMGASPQRKPLENGLLCVGGSLQRFPILSSSTWHAVHYGPGLPGTLHVSSFTTTYFQLWLRDPNGPCGGSSNLSNAVSVSWLP